MVISTAGVQEDSRTQWMNAAEWLRQHPGVFGKDTFYARVSDGSIPSLKIGRKVLVPEDLLDRMLAGQSSD